MLQPQARAHTVSQAPTPALDRPVMLHARPKAMCRPLEFFSCVGYRADGATFQFDNWLGAIESGHKEKRTMQGGALLRK